MSIFRRWIDAVIPPTLEPSPPKPPVHPAMFIDTDPVVDDKISQWIKDVVAQMVEWEAAHPLPPGWRWRWETDTEPIERLGDHDYRTATTYRPVAEEI